MTPFIEKTLSKEPYNELDFYRDEQEEIEFKLQEFPIEYLWRV